MEVGIIGDAALYSGYAPDTVELFRNLWSQERMNNPKQSERGRIGLGLP